MRCGRACGGKIHHHPDRPHAAGSRSPAACSQQATATARSGDALRMSVPHPRGRPFASTMFMSRDECARGMPTRRHQPSVTGSPTSQQHGDFAPTFTSTLSTTIAKLRRYANDARTWKQYSTSCAEHSHQNTGVPVYQSCTGGVLGAWMPRCSTKGFRHLRSDACIDTVQITTNAYADRSQPLFSSYNSSTVVRC